MTARKSKTPAALAAGQTIAHVPTLNVGVIRDLLDGELAVIDWTAGGSTGESTVPLGELVANPDGVTISADVAELVAPAARAAADAAASLAALQSETIARVETDEARAERHQALDVRRADDAAQRADEAKITAGARRRRKPAAAAEPIAQVPGSPLVEVPAPDLTAELTADGGVIVTPTRRRRAAAEPTEPAEPTPVDVEFVLDNFGNFRVHRAGCADVPREIKKFGQYDQPGTATYVDQLSAVRDLWDDQIREQWDADPERRLHGPSVDTAPPVEWLVDHGYVVTVVFVPCVRRSLGAIPGIDQARTVRDTNAHGDVAGYVLIKSRNEFDQFRRIDPDGDGDEWLTRCNAHGTTSTWPSRNASRWHGWLARRVDWCRKCKNEQAKLARERAAAAAAADAAADATAEHDAAVKSGGAS